VVCNVSLIKHINLFLIAFVPQPIDTTEVADTPVSTPTAIETGVSVSVRIPRHTTVGTSKAGLICIPDGRFKIEDFVASEASLKGAILYAFAEKGIARPEYSLQVIELTDLKVNLCARDYIFDKRLYSGKATFTFLLKWTNGSETIEVLPLVIDKRQSQSEQDVLQSAVTALIERISTKVR